MPSTPYSITFHKTCQYTAIYLSDMRTGVFGFARSCSMIKELILEPRELRTMFINHDELMWILRRIYGQRYCRATLIDKFKGHSISSILPYYDKIDLLFDSLDDKISVINKLIPALRARTNTPLPNAPKIAGNISYTRLKHELLPAIVEALNAEQHATLEPGARVMVRLNSTSFQAKPGSEGFITGKSEQHSTVRFYAISGRFSTDTVAAEMADDDLEVMPQGQLNKRHDNLSNAAEYLFDDALLRAMRNKLDADVYASVANLTVNYLVQNGFLRPDGEEFSCVLEQIFPVLAPEFDKTYRNRKLFTSSTLSSPPSERKAHVLSLELTSGCDYNRCTFCTEYADLPVATKTVSEFKKHVDQVADAIGSARSGIQRLFIGSGNSLGVETEQLLQSLAYARETFHPQKITLYGRTSAILAKSPSALDRIKEAGVTLIYWGLESGSDEVLSYTNKGCSQKDMIAAAQKLSNAGIDVSAMLIPGLGGLKFSDQHIMGSLELLHNIDIKYLTLMAINPDQESQYAKNMRTETDNRHLTADEVNHQVYKFLTGLQPTGLQIGMFTGEIDLVSSNTKRFNTEFTPANKEALLNFFWN